MRFEKDSQERGREEGEERLLAFLARELFAGTCFSLCSRARVRFVTQMSLSRLENFRTPLYKFPLFCYYLG